MTDWKLSFGHGKVMGKKESKLTIIALFLCANAHLNGHSFKIIIALTFRSQFEGSFSFVLDIKTYL